MKKNIKNIFLIGPMGAGKSSIGHQVAKYSHKTFMDSDHEIQRRTGVPLAWIFEAESEAGFRKRETEVIDELTQMNNVVLSTGGGCVVTEANRQFLIDRGIIVYLQVSLEEQVRRTKRKDTRPLIDVPEPKKKLIELNEKRTVLYEEIADITCNTDDSTPTILAKFILKEIKRILK
ncbi:MAG: shikimate kinase AroK [Gammaproteobacteria bacterium]|nr:shikimate kinase AroK [Gammaproteobacteria bacterium]MCH9744389.1 shikimate kinase AroK [Gammaproteobacteria bacterium]